MGTLQLPPSPTSKNDSEMMGEHGAAIVGEHDAVMADEDGKDDGCARQCELDGGKNDNGHERWLDKHDSSKQRMIVF